MRRFRSADAVPPEAAAAARERSRRIAEAAFVATTAAWGLSFVIVTWALRSCGPVTLTAIRMTTGFATIVLLARPRLLRTTGLEVRAGVLAGVFLAGGYLLQTVGLVTASAGAAAFLTAFYVALVPVVECFVYRRLPAGRDVVVLLLACAGIALMVVRPVTLTISPGEGLVALSALCWAVHIVVVGRVADRVRAPAFAAWQILTVAVLAVVLLPFVDERPVEATAAFAGHVLYLGVVTTAVAFVIQAWGQRIVPPTRAAILFSPEPVFAALFGVWLLGESYGWKDVAGAALVLTAVGVTLLGRARTQPDLTPAAPG